MSYERATDYGFHCKIEFKIALQQQFYRKMPMKEYRPCEVIEIQGK
jgi:hypothetical protein